MPTRNIISVLKLFITFTILTILANCGGGGGGGGDESIKSDSAPPQIVSTGPGDEAGINEPITITFSEQIDQSSLTPSTIRVSGGVTGIISYNSGSNTVNFRPSANLLPLTTYSITVNPGIKDLLGNTITGTYVTEFTTGEGISVGSWTPIEKEFNYTDGIQKAVWTGSDVIILGMSDDPGARFNPTTGSYVSLGLMSVPFLKGGCSAIWTGSTIILWGGTDGTSLYNTGSIYNPSTNTWTPTSTVYAPSPRRGHFAVWTGTEMIVWGGWDGINYLNTGGRYNPSANTWLPVSTINAPTGREIMDCNSLSCSDNIAMQGIWTGSEMIVWGGWDGVQKVTTGGRYNPTTGQWAPISTVNAPSSSNRYSAVWTGSEMIVWGVDTGARYNPQTDTWNAISTVNAPSGGTAPVWTGSVMIVWGGGQGNRTGGIYNPSTDTWTATNVGGAPWCGGAHFACWTGSEMVVLRRSGTYWMDGRYYRAVGGGGIFRP